MENLNLDSRLETSYEHVSKELILSPEEIQEWWPIYDEQFREMNRSHPCRQSFNQAEFEDAMVDQSVLKYVYKEDGEISSMCLFGTDLDVFPWLSQDFFQGQYPEAFEENNLLYFMALLTKSDNRGQHHATKLIEYLVDDVKNGWGVDEVVISFDCSQTNAEFLPGLVESAIEGTGLADLSLKEQGSQHYYAGKVEFN